MGVWIKKDDNISEILDNLFSNPDKLSEMKNNAILLGNPNSTENICSILLKCERN